jgi:hypothetical protein
MNELEAKVARMTRQERKVRLEILNVKLKILFPEALAGRTPEPFAAADMLERDYLMRALVLR